MFGKVPPSNTAGPTSHGGLSLSKSCTRPTGTACLPCFSVDENCASSNEDKPKPWRPKDVGLVSVVSEAPCNTLQICPTPCPNGLTSPVCSTRVVPLVPKHSSKESSTTVHVARNHLGTKNGSPNITGNSVHKCSSNPNCPSFTKSTCCSGTSGNRAPQRVLTSSSLSNLSVENQQSKDVLVAGTSSTRKKHRDAVLIISKDQVNGKMLGREQQATRNPLVQAATPLANNPKSTRLSSEAVHSVTTSGKSGRSSSCTEATIARDDLIVTDSSSNFANDAIVPANGYQTESSTYVGQKSRTCGGKDNSGDCVASSSPGPPTASIPSATSSSSSNITTTSSSCSSSSSSGTCNDRGSSHRGDFTSSIPTKDWHRNGALESTQPSCMPCLPQDLPTELQSSPRSYKDREKCRDPWRPTEMDSGVYGLNPVCPGDTGHQDVVSKRRTGASCQALRHAVASLNRLDDFYMEKIGAGFFSEVFKVTHKVTSQVMVLKMNQLPANRPNMLKEVQLMNKLSHPNILRFMGVCVHEGQLHALTEYINGGSLEQLIMSRHTALPHAIRMNLARDVARGMAYLHSRGLFHRDLTSKNVLIKRDEISEEEHLTAVVGDFGLAAKIPDPSSGYRLSTVGSPYWMSPECLKGQWYDHRSDVFSFGIVVCELIGRVPADPDVLPRSDNFGLDYLAVAEICAAADPPPAFLQLAFNCCTYEPKSRPTFPEIVTSLDGIIANYEDESKGNIGKRQSADPTLMSSMDEIVREGRTTKRRTSRLRSQSADARGCDNATPSDKARCHSARRVAELASRRDPHYRPMTANPFHALGGVKKILGDLFSSCLELPSLEDVRPSVTDTATKFKPAQNDSIAKILDRKKPNSEPSSPTARKKWERKVATKVGAASLFAHPLFRDGWEPRRRGSCESGFWSCVGEDLSPEPPNRRHTSTLSSSAASSLFLLDDHRTSSIYTDSSEDIASLGGGDSSCWEDRLSGIGSSSKTISKIVEYFERKQATASSLRLGDHDAGPSRIALLRASLDGPVPLCSISAAQRLVVCEGAVRSKLPLFDKK